MNRAFKNIRFLILLLLLINSGSRLFAQSPKKNNQLQKQNKTLTLQDAITAIESNSNYIFNYDPTLLSGYYYNKEIDLSVIDNLLDQIFYDTPLTYDIENNTIVVYLPNPKSYSICGTLVDAISLEPLIAANITLVNTTIGTQSDLSGFFNLECLANKNQQIEISYLGYEPIRFSLQEIKNKDCEHWNMKIDSDLIGSQIIISDYLLDGISLGQKFTAFHLDFDQLSKNHSNVEHDIFKTAQLLPGINSIDDSATNLQIRGSDPGQNLILWEGVPLYNAGHVFGMVSAINPFSIEQVSIYKGAHSPQYDNRVGGILDISLADDLANDFRGSIGTSFTELHSNLSIPILKDKLSLEIAGRQSINGLFNSPTLQSYIDKVFQFTVIDDQKNIPEEDQLRTSQTLAYHDWNAKLLYRPTDRLQFYGGVYRNAQDFTYSFWFDGDPYLSEDKINIKTEIVNFNTKLKVTKDWTSNLAIYQSSYTNDYQKSGSENGIVIDSNDQVNNIQEQSITFSNELKIASNIQLNLGYEYNQKEVELDLGKELIFTPIKLEQARFHNLFQSISYTLKNLQIDAGNRTSYYQARDSWFHSPRINLRYTVSKHLKLKADAGVYHQFISQLTNVGSTQIKVDNPLWILNASEESLSQKANKIAAGFVFQKGKWLFDIDAFYNRITNISSLAPQLGIIINEYAFSKGTSTVMGVDLLLKKRWSSGINTWLSYSLGFATYDFPEFSEISFPASNDIRHNLSFVTSYKYKNLQLSLNTNYHSGLPFSQAELTLNEIDPDPDPPFLYFLTYDSFNNDRLNRYLRMDLNVAYRFGFKPIKDSQIEISCSLLNVLDRTHFVAREYFIDYNETTTEYKLSFIQKALLDRTALLLLRFYW